MLAHSLHALEGDGFVLRVVSPTKPPKVEYSLTPLGRELAAHIQPLTQWVEANVSRVLEHRKALTIEREKWGTCKLGTASRRPGAQDCGSTHCRSNLQFCAAFPFAV